MIQSELDEISEAFLDAWKEYFGQVVRYIPMLTEFTNVEDLYLESKRKQYDIENAVEIWGSIKYKPTKEELEEAGLTLKTSILITCVTKDLVDNGIEYLDMNGLIEIPDRFGSSVFYNIKEKSLKVQFSNNYIFIKIGADVNDS